MKSNNASQHLYSAVLAVVVTAVTVPFHPGIPVWAWVLAFIVLFLVAECCQVFLASRSGGEASGASARQPRLLITFAVCVAIAVVGVAVGYVVT
ncbi:hypothetical protein [Corynebacterium bovis]|uniref:Phosphatidylglycerophosphate synthase n=1 Tax=Corynebacterium bovis DSM 20582 = CIP 54.80 TaxID=927655 RepID=A0A8H9Y8L0_9CORY|nr:hypothetical protein [Corynebacterium bovis]MBB3116065.1 phosphatidylglycerophosphate synthase [Corynebacterium bovis DSM 20582 = CIP 54.80]MDK8510781.1 hypothetical protein [Corynebacterium bovis]QQC47002.1 hypothetical protein I6I09_07925 [Corynebacterium bovis]WJY76651.1 hypothetical protein CBOVI_00495 [Corynebacterium bovis DSM 20582 = CIP 54.80]